MRVIVAGSRECNSKTLVFEAIKRSGVEASVIISGCARGVDSIGELFAIENKIKCDRFPANWNKYGKSAGYKRNEQMAQNADCLIAIWDGESRGTKHMIDIARRYKLKIYVYIVKNK